MKIDPRGIQRKIVNITKSSEGGATLIGFDCGHTSHFNQTFEYALGSTHHCYQCGQDEKLRDAAPDLYKALKKSAEGWANALELGLIPEQHRTSASILRDEARELLATLNTPAVRGGE